MPLGLYSGELVIDILETSGVCGVEREPMVLVTEEEDARRMVVSFCRLDCGFALSAEDTLRLREIDGGMMSRSLDWAMGDPRGAEGPADLGAGGGGGAKVGVLESSPFGWRI